MDNSEALKYHIENALKKSVLDEKKRWLYSLCLWVLRKQYDTDYQHFQMRIDTSIHNNEGYYKQFYVGRNGERHNKLMMKYYALHKGKYIDRAKLSEKRNRVLWSLYKRGLLSEHSSKKIAKELHKLEFD